MNRRTFVAVGASVAAVTASGAAAGILQQHQKGAGERVTLSGWMQPAANGPGHYFVLGPSQTVSDPRAEDYALWPDDLTLVYPADARTMSSGKVTLEGRLYRGRFKDVATGHAARAVLAEARLV
jgi:hypothetical protein